MLSPINESHTALERIDEDLMNEEEHYNLLVKLNTYQFNKQKTRIIENLNVEDIGKISV